MHHVLNRAARRALLFATSADYAAFLRVLEEAKSTIPIRLLAFCVMPNHWHLVLWPRLDGDLSRFMHWLTMTHAQRWHADHGTAGTGGLYQGRFKSIPVQNDRHLLSVCRYVERNPARANLVARAEDWRWSSLWHRRRNCAPALLDSWPILPPADWIDHVNQPQNEAELRDLRKAITRGVPYGDPSWSSQTAIDLKLPATIRPRGRPGKGSRPLIP